MSTPLHTDCMYVNSFFDSGDRSRRNSELFTPSSTSSLADEGTHPDADRDVTTSRQPRDKHQVTDSEPSDEQLLLAATTDPEAFEVFFRRHAPAVLGYFMRRTRDPEASADLMAETFAAALLGLRRFRRR